MFKIPKIEESDFYFKQILKATEETAAREKEEIRKRFKHSKGTQRKSKDDVNIDKRKDLELNKIRSFNFKTNNYLRKITSKFPKFDKLSSLYLKLLDTSKTTVEITKHSLEQIKELLDEFDTLSKRFEAKVKKAKTQETLGYLMKKYFGKAAASFRKYQKDFLILRDAAHNINSLPHFEDLFTVSIAGFPNVGKSTLMKKVSGSNVEIQNYPFTTKQLMFSYLLKNSKKKVQLIDTPGLLGRDKQNSIEMQAQIIIAEYSEIIVFVLDITESCGYSLDEQIKLLEKTKELEKNMVIYFSKSDLFEEKEKKLYQKLKQELGLSCIEDFEKLKEDLLKQAEVKERKSKGKIIESI